MEEDVSADPQELHKNLIDETLFEYVEGIIKSKRAPMPELPVAERIKSFIEADQVLSEKAALGESMRCLFCCLTCYNPDQATDETVKITDLRQKSEVA
jgi:hypothetical protein